MGLGNMKMHRALEPESEVKFSAPLFRYEGKGGWTFVMVPEAFQPCAVGAWGMTPVLAEVDGRQWQTTVWRDKEGRRYLPVPKKIRGRKEAPAEVAVILREDRARAMK
jgi:hypothetical protein